MSLLNPKDKRQRAVQLALWSARIPVRVTQVVAQPGVSDHVAVVAVPTHTGLTDQQIERAGQVILSSFGLSHLIAAGRRPGGVVVWEAADRPAADRSAPVERLAPWRPAALAAYTEGGTPQPLGTLAAEYPALVAALSSDQGWPQLVAPLATSSDAAQGPITVRTTQPPRVHYVQQTRRGVVLAVDASGAGVPGWQRVLPALAAALRLPGLTVVPRLAEGLVLLEGRDRQIAFPSAVSLPLTGVAAYPDTQVPLGVDEVGDVVWWTPRTQPHVLAIGSTGGGKSVALRGLISAVLAAPSTDPQAAWSVMLADGKGSDYAALRGHPGVRIVSDEVPGHIWLVATARQEVDRRRSLAAKAKAAGESDPYAAFPPLLVLLDEWADVSAQIASRHGKRGLEEVQADIASILRVGREARVHLVIATQEMRVEAVPGSWQENLKSVLSLGRPSQQTLRVAFPGDELREAAGALAAQIPQSARGRGLIVDADTGAATLFQSLWQYSPGTTPLDTAPTPQVRAAWEQTARVLAARPQTAPRIAPRVDGPEWRDLDVPELRDLAPVLLDTPDGPDPAARCYDPARPEWIGAEALDAGSGLDWGAAPPPVPEPEPAVADLTDHLPVIEIDMETLTGEAP